MRSSVFRLLPLLLAGALAAACGDAPTATPETEMAELGFSLNLSGTDVRLMVVDVTAPDITQPLVYNVEVQNGVATGHIDVPPGQARTIRVRAYDFDRVQTHEGSATMDVKPGNNPPLKVTLNPSAGHVPLTVDFGSIVVSVRAADGPHAPTGEYIVGQQVRFEATVTTADGTPVPGAVVRWASLNPGVMSIGENGTAAALHEGTTTIGATYSGYGASISIPVTAKTDFEAPTVTSASFDSVTVTAQHGWSLRTRLSVGVVDNASGVDSVAVQVRGVARPGTGWGCPTMFGGSTTPFYCHISVWSSTPADDYVVTEIVVKDRAGNIRRYTREQLAAMGINPRVTVINNTGYSTSIR